jgi:hypothetical protein
MEDETKNLLHRQKNHFFMSGMLPQKKMHEVPKRHKKQAFHQNSRNFFHKNGSRSIIYC